MTPTVLSTAVVLLAVALAPVVALAVGRIVRVPVVVFEIILGMLVGPAVLNWVQSGDVLHMLSNFGLILLFFMAGNELDFRGLGGRPLRRSVIGWLISLAGGLIIGFAVTGSVNGVYVAIALCSTSLGTLMPVLRDSGILGTPLGGSVVAVGAAGEFLPLIAISVFLSGRQPLLGALVLLAFVVIAGLAVALSLWRRMPRFDSFVAASLGTSAQFAVRLVLVLMAALVVLSLTLGLDMLLGAFAAGILARALLRGVSSDHAETLDRKFEAVSFGVFVPVFFVMTGVTFDFAALFADTWTLLLLPAFTVALLVVRGLPGMLAAPVGASFADRRSLAFFSGTGLPLIVAVVGIALDQNAIAPGIGSALIGAGMLSVLFFPVLALVGRSVPQAEPQASEEPDDTLEPAP